jgi:hypothetical protein
MKNVWKIYAIVMLRQPNSAEGEQFGGGANAEHFAQKTEGEDEIASGAIL